MATSKQSFVRATEPQYSVSAQREEEMHVKAPLTTMYVHTGSAPGLQPYSQAQPGASQDATVVPLFLPRMCSNQPLPSLTLHIASSTALQQQRLGAPATSSRPKSIGKHVCPHCGKDCLKPSVLEKHLRCHTGERPYPCTTCGISFKTQSNLYKHKRTQAHARLSNESDKGIFSSQESTDISKDTCISPSSEMHGEDSADVKKSDDIFPAVSVTTHGQVISTEGKTEFGTECALHKADMVGSSTTLAVQDKVKYLSKNVESSDVKEISAPKKTSVSSEDGRALLTPNRTPLQRQEALFSKPWESPMSRGKSQSHDSTDSGFSDCSEHHSSSSPGVSLHDPSMESLPETALKQQEPGASQASSNMTPEDPKSKVSIHEKQKLEEHISKLIYENSVLVEDKQLENVRPRKTVLSKQGSIDLPVPYTYKDSFHFEIRSSKHISSSQKQDRRGGAIYSSVPTQHSTSLEHAPLTRSSSLPFTVGGKYTDGAINPNLSRRCSTGHVYPFRTTDQQAPGHRSLVRQVAIDCLPSDGSSIDRGSISSLSSDGDSTDIGTEPSIKGNYRKKTRKFDYTKWHTYKGGTFRKLYNTDRDSPLKTRKTAPSIEQTESLEMQISQPKDNAPVSLNVTSCSVLCLSQTGHMSLAQVPNQALSSYMLRKSSPLEKTSEECKQNLSLQNDPKDSYTSFENSNVKSADVEREKLVMQRTFCHIPSERKKQRTGNDVHMTSVSNSRTGQENANLCGLMSQTLLSTYGTHGLIKVPAQKVNAANVHPQSSFTHQFSNPSQLLCKTTSPDFCMINMSGTSGTPSVSTSNPTVPKAKTSFPPKYQLKIPCSTDGVSASCSGSTLAHNTYSTIPALRQSHQTTVLCHSKDSLPPSKQCQAASIVTPFDQSTQGATALMPVLSASSSGQNPTNTLSKELTELQPTMPTSVSLVSPVTLPTVQHQISLIQSNYTKDVVENQSACPVSSVLCHPPKANATSENIQSVTSLNAVSTISCCSESTETPQIYSSETMSPTIQYNPASTVFTFGKPPGLAVDLQSTVYKNTLNSTATKISTGDFQSSQSEGQVLLLSGSGQSQAQNTFYVRTADLQIVMQLISDEQLALIEPHIEIPDFKRTESYSVTSSICTSQTSLSQDVYSNDVTDVCVEQNLVNNGEMGKKNDKLSFNPYGSINSEDKAENAGGLNLHDAKNDASANSNLQCVSSWSHPQTKFHISTSMDYRDNSERFYEPHRIPKNSQDRKCVGFNVTTESHHKQVAGDKLSELRLVDKSNLMRKDDKEHYSVCSLDSVNSSDSKVTFRQDQTSTDMKEELSIKKTLPKERFCLMESYHSQTIKNTELVEPIKTRNLMPVTILRDGEGVQTMRTTQIGSCISEKKIPIATSTESQQMLFSTIQPSQNKSCSAACSALNSTTREMKACGTDKLSCKPGAQWNETICLGQAPTQYEIQQTMGLDPGEFGNHIDNIMLNRTSNCILGDSTTCGDVPVHTHHASLDIFTGTGEHGALKSLRFQKYPGTVSKESAPKKLERAVEDEEKQSTKMADTNNTGRRCENNGQQHKRKEEVCEEHQTAAQAHPHLSQDVNNASLNISDPIQHDKCSVPKNPEPSVCNILSQTCQPQGQEGCSNYTKRDSKDGICGKSTSEETNQRETASPGYGAVSGLGVAGYANQTCRHLLVRRQFQKETQKNNVMTHWTPKGTQAQVISPQHKLISTTGSGSVLQNHCDASTTEVVNTSMIPSSCSGSTHSNTSHQIYNQMPQTNQICPLATVINSTDSKLFYLGNNSYLEHEDSNSSSDDEQKLVIELE